MYKLKLLSLLAICIHLTTSALCSVGYNGKLLYEESQSCASKIWTRRVPEEEIRRSLEFVYKPEQIDQKYAQDRGFKSFLETSQAELQDEKLTQFALTCKTVFDKGDLRTKIGAYLLYENVFREYSSFLKQYRNIQVKKREEEERAKASGRSNTVSSEFLEMFANADKGVDMERFKQLIQEQTSH